MKEEKKQTDKSIFKWIIDARNKQLAKGYTPDSDRQQYGVGQLACIGFDIIKGRNNSNAIHNHLINKYRDDQISQEELFAHAIALIIADYEAFGIGMPMPGESESSTNTLSAESLTDFLEVTSAPEPVYRGEYGVPQDGRLSSDQTPPLDEDPIIVSLARIICNDDIPCLREMREYISGLNEPFLEEEINEVRAMLLECPNTFEIIRHARRFTLTVSTAEQIIARTIRILSGREASATQPF